MLLAFSTDGVQQGLSFLLDGLGFTDRDNAAEINALLKESKRLRRQPELAAKPELLNEVREMVALAVGVLQGAKHEPAPPSV